MSARIAGRLGRYDSLQQRSGHTQKSLMASGAQVAHYISSPISRIFPVIVAAAVAAAIVIGWLERDEEYLTPDSGLGYWLGIYGSAAMLLLLFYSLRKRAKAARSLGSVRFWFRTHMLLGILGPLLILFHANFKLGPLNSNVALFSMLIVAVSGVVGKYLYGKIHMGMYGQKAEAKQLLAEAEELSKHIGSDLQAAAFVSQELKAFSESIKNKAPATALASLWAGAIIAIRTRTLRAQVVSEARRLIRIEARSLGWSWRQQRQAQRKVADVVTLYCTAVRKAAELTFFERLFSLWHVLHLPLFFLMLLAACVHVWAAHHY